MKKVLVFGASNSLKSINKTLASYAASLLNDCELSILDLNDYEMPIYSMEREEGNGIPDSAKEFFEKVDWSDGIIISFAEHNGSYSVAFKNILDWSSRYRQKVWSDRNMLLLSTSPGGRGGATVLCAAEQTFPHLGGKIVATFSLPSYYKNFVQADGIVNKEFKGSFDDAILKFDRAIHD